MKLSISYQRYNIHATRQGKGSPLLFLHGWPTNGRLWTEQVEAFSESHTVLTLDWLGFGKSDKPEDFPYSFSRKKEQLDAVVTAADLGEEKITLIAHDIGGPPAILWAEENPNKVRRLILLNTVLYPLKTPLDAVSEVLFATPGIQQLVLNSFGLANIMKSNTKSGRKGLKGRIKEILGDFQEVSVSHKRHTIHHPMSEGRKKELLTLAQVFKDLPIEKHLIIAKEDPLCYAHIHKLSQENPDVPVHPIQKCGHYIPLDRPNELSGILNRILS